jgi:hypothetical protein
MKAVKFILIFLVSIIVLGIAGLFIFIKTLDLNKYLPQITEAASKAAGRPITIGSADLNISLKGIVLDATAIRMVDAGPSPKLDVAAEKAHAQVEVMPLIKDRKIQISSITLDNVKVNMTDPMPINIVVPEVEARVRDFSLDKPFYVEIDARFASAVKNIHATSNVQIIQNQSKAILTNAVVQTDLSQWNMAEIRAITPILKDVPLPVALGGQIKLNADRIEAGATGLGDINAQVVITNGMVKLKELLTPITALQLNASVGLNNAILRDLSFNIGEGKITGQAEIKEYLTTQQFSVKTNVTGVKIEDLIDQDPLPVGMKGKINASTSVSGRGFTPELLYRNLKGEGQAEVIGGVIERLNILKAALGSTLGKIPGVADMLDNVLMESLKGKLGENATVLDKAQAKFTIDEGTFFLDQAIATNPAFEAAAEGTITFINMTVNMPVNVVLAPDVSAELAGKIEQLSYLFDDQKRIRISGALTGVIPNVKFNSSSIVKNAAAGAIVDQIFDKNPELKEAAEPAKQIINDVLNNIFK